MKNVSRFALGGLVALALLGAGAVAGSLVTASADPTPVTFNACLADGVLFRVGASVPSCPKGASAVSWSQTGPQGQPGPQGATGATGAQGPAGPQGASGPVTATTVELGPITVTAGTFNQLTATCPIGMLAVAGNYYVNQNGDAGSFPALSVKYSGPTISDTSWTVGVTNSGGTDQPVRLHVLCVTGSES
jgi:hypothetical protein